MLSVHWKYVAIECIEKDARIIHNSAPFIQFHSLVIVRAFCLITFAKNFKNGKNDTLWPAIRLINACAKQCFRADIREF